MNQYRKCLTLIIQRLIILLLFVEFSMFGVHWRTNAQATQDDPKRNVLVGDLRYLDSEARRLDSQLARAFASTEIAAAVRTIDPTWFKELLVDALRRTFPPEAEQGKAQGRSANVAPRPASSVDRSRRDIQARIFAVAAPDKELIKDLDAIASSMLTSYERNLLDQKLAREALDRGDLKSVREFAEKTFATNPGQGGAIAVINELAQQDRKAADDLAILYINALRQVPLSSNDPGFAMTQLSLIELIYPNLAFPDPTNSVKGPGPEVMRAYASYVVECLSNLEQRSPGSVKAYRSFLLSAWLPIKQYYPSLTGRFLDLEMRSRRPGQDPTLPLLSPEDVERERQQSRLKEALGSDRVDERTINYFIGRRDFANARKLLEKMDDGPMKQETVEKLNAQEALFLTAGDDLIGAQRLAISLKRSVSILDVYTAMIRAYVKKRNLVEVQGLTYQAVRQLRDSDPQLSAPRPNMPVAGLVTNREFDPVLRGMSRFAMEISTVSDSLAFDVFAEFIAAANKSSIDTSEGRIGFDVAVFRTVAVIDLERARGLANEFKDRLRRISALAAICQYEVSELNKRAKPDTRR